jgi:type II secretion system protein H
MLLGVNSGGSWKRRWKSSRCDDSARAERAERRTEDVLTLSDAPLCAARRVPPSGGLGGFTLVELMVVIVIIGITSAVIVSEMGGSFEAELLHSTAHKIIDACDAASHRAIAVHQPQLLRIDPTSGHFAIAPKNPELEQEDTGIDMAGAFGELDTRIALAIREPKTDDEESDEPTTGEQREQSAQAGVITFFPDGTADAREFFLRDRAGVEMVLRINPITGRVRILDDMEVASR